MITEVTIAVIGAVSTIATALFASAIAHAKGRETAKIEQQNGFLASIKLMRESYESLIITLKQDNAELRLRLTELEGRQ